MSTVGTRGPNFVLVNRWDVLVAGVFFAYALAFQLGRWQGLEPFTGLAGDAGNIASYAAALDHPAAFVNDSSLGNPRELRFYAAVHVRLLRVLKPMFGSYGSAFIWLVGVHVFTLGIGFYVFGRGLFRDRRWAVILAVAMVQPVAVGLGTYWGTFRDPQPRFTFSALLPFVLALAIHWRNQPRRWPLLMAAMGGLIYVHPVSAPAWGFAVWLGLWSSRAPTGKRRPRVVLLALSGVAFLAVATPFLIAYVGARADSTAIDLRLWQRVISMGYRDASIGLSQVFSRLTEHHPILLAWGTAAALFQVGWGRYRRNLARLVGIWTVGLGAVSFGIPYFEQWRAAQFDAVPMQVDLIRGLRFVVPILILFCVWSLVEVHARLSAPAWAASRSLLLRSAPLLAGAILAAAWTVQRMPASPRTGARCWLRGEVYCRNPGVRERSEALRMVETQIPRGATLLTSSVFLSAAVRYETLRPLVHSRLDFGVFLYARHGAIPRWQHAKAFKRRANQVDDPPARLKAFVHLASRQGADYALVEFATDRCVEHKEVLAAIAPSCEDTRVGVSCHEIVWSNSRFTIVRTS